MEAVRIMPCIDMKAGRVVKGVHFVDIRDATNAFGPGKITVAIDARRNAKMPSGFELERSCGIPVLP